MRLLTAAFAALLLIAPTYAAGQATGGAGSLAVPPPPAPVRDILYSRPFTLERPYRSDWSKERPTVSAGVLVVLEVDPALVVPRDTLEPVLYAGNVTVQRLNHGHRSGRVIGIIPGNIDLANTLIWFGAPELPERVTPDIVRSERARAETAGVQALGSTKIASISHPPVAAADLSTLLREVAAQLVDEYSPQERELADQWRLPTAEAPSRSRP